MAIETPDWISPMALIGDDAGTPRLIAVDADGQLYAIAKGEDGSGTLRPLAVDGDGQIIMVPRGQGGNYLAVDPSGYLTTILKGDYEGALRTVKLDDAGRISAFVVDSSDVWEEIVQVGNAELAARLGGLPRYHRAGQVHFLEDFEQGWARWGTSLVGTGAAAELTAETASTGGYSVKLTGGSDKINHAQLEARRGILPAGRMGMAFAFSIPDTIRNIYVILAYYDGSTVHEAGIQFSDLNNDLRYYGSGGMWEKIDDVRAAQRYNYSFNYIKVVVDFSIDEYVSAFFNNREFDLTGTAVSSGADSTPPGYLIQLTLLSRETHNDVAYVDDIVMTGAEPA